MFQRYVVSVLDGCYKNRSGCCICCNGSTLILQRSMTNVSSVFLESILRVCLSRFCICFRHMLQVFYLDVVYICNDFSSVFRSFFQVFQKNASNVLSIFFFLCCI